MDEEDEKKKHLLVLVI